MGKYRSWNQAEQTNNGCNDNGDKGLRRIATSIQARQRLYIYLDQENISTVGELLKRVHKRVARIVTMATP